MCSHVGMDLKDYTHSNRSVFHSGNFNTLCFLTAPMHSMIFGYPRQKWIMIRETGWKLWLIVNVIKYKITRTWEVLWESVLLHECFWLSATKGALNIYVTKCLCHMVKCYARFLKEFLCYTKLYPHTVKSFERNTISKTIKPADRTLRVLQALV